MKKRKKLVCTSATVVVAFIISGCMWRSKETMPGPEGTVSGFHSAMARGQFGMASGFCDTLLMKEYMERYISEWDRVFGHSDSSTCAIACGIIENAEMKTVSCTRKGGRAEVIYCLQAAGYPRKNKKAELRKDGEGWKIEKITEAD